MKKEARENLFFFSRILLLSSRVNLHRQSVLSLCWRSTAIFTRFNHDLWARPVDLQSRKSSSHRRERERKKRTTTMTTPKYLFSWPVCFFLCRNPETGGCPPSNPFCFDRRGISIIGALALSKSRSPPCNRRGSLIIDASGVYRWLTRW